jgi:2-iminobutanoate/2-iminopropanoate deaminase
VSIVCLPMSHHRETVTAAGAPAAAGPYSHAVKAGGLLFISGQVNVDPESNELVGETPGDQARRCLDNLGVIASAAGASLADAARITIYCTDISVFKAINEAYGAYWESDPPARVTIGVAALPLGAQLEMDAVIALPD